MVSSSVSYLHFQGEKRKWESFYCTNGKDAFRLRHPMPESCTSGGRCICCAVPCSSHTATHSTWVWACFREMRWWLREGAEGKACLSLAHRWELVLTQRLSKVLSGDFGPLFCRKERLNDNTECDVCICHLFKHQSLEGFKPLFTHYFTPVFVDTCI